MCRKLAQHPWSKGPNSFGRIPSPLPVFLAWAATIYCSGGDCSTDSNVANDNNTFLESPFNDHIIGGRGADDIFAQFFRGDRDRVDAAQNDDFINVRDHDNRDSVDCGKGRDVVQANRGTTSPITARGYATKGVPYITR
jgi:hypothetical protein